MDDSSELLIHKMAQKYLNMLADFPARLCSEHIDIDSANQQKAFNGLKMLHEIIERIYEYFIHLDPVNETRSVGAWNDNETCYGSIEAPIKLLWALGYAGRLEHGPGGMELRIEKVRFESAAKSRPFKDKDFAIGLKVLGAVGFVIEPRNPDDQPCPGGYKKCVSLGVRFTGGPEGSEAENEAVLLALGCYARRLPAGKNGMPIDLYLRADFRPCLPDYKFPFPHMLVEEDEVERSMPPAALESWREMVAFMGRAYPKLTLFYRTPRIRHGEWIGDFGMKANDYGFWSILAQEDGFHVRLVLKKPGVGYLLGHLDEFSPAFQEMYLNSVPCRDCVHCGEEIYVWHGDHTHRICKGPWFVSPSLTPEMLPDVEKLVDIHLAHLK